MCFRLLHSTVIVKFTFLGPGTKRERTLQVKDAVSAEEELRPEGSQLTPVRKPLPRSPVAGTSIVKG